MRDATTADTRALEARLSTCPVTCSKKYVNQIDMSGTGPHSRKTQPKKSLTVENGEHKQQLNYRLNSPANIHQRILALNIPPTSFVTLY